MEALKLQVRLKQAQNALKDGRLDEAFAIALERGIRELRGGQVLLDDLVEPLLSRARAHCEGGRLREALLDAERAVQAGGNRPEAVGLRGELRERVAALEATERRNAELLRSARDHIARGSFANARSLLAELEERQPGGRPAEGPPRLPGGHPEAEQLLRELAARERRGAEARMRTRARLDEGDLAGAITALRAAEEAYPQGEELAALRSETRRATEKAASAAFSSGDLEGAAMLLERAGPLFEESLETRRIASAVRLVQRSREEVARGRFEAARSAVREACGIAPEAIWLAAVDTELAGITEALARLRASPVGRAPDVTCPGGGHGDERRPPRKPREIAAPATFTRDKRSPLLLWVDGVGTYVLIPWDRVSLGRLGSSARADIPLQADIAGFHAEIVRSDDDYFLVAAQGKVAVGGQPTSRRLLAHGDVITLGAALKIAFELPSPLSPTAVLSLGMQRLTGDVRTVILLKEHLIIGPRENSHIVAPGSEGAVVLSLDGGALRCRSEAAILMDGKLAASEAIVPLGAHVQVGKLTFTITQ